VSFETLSKLYMDGADVVGAVTLHLCLLIFICVDFQLGWALVIIIIIINILTWPK